MTKEEQRLAEQQDALEVRMRQLRRRQREIQAKQTAFDRQRRDRRLMEVGRLAEAAGLLWIEDDVLEKLFARVAEQLQTAREERRDETTA